MAAVCLALIAEQSNLALACHVGQPGTGRNRFGKFELAFVNPLESCVIVAPCRRASSMSVPAE